MYDGTNRQAADKANMKVKQVDIAKFRGVSATSLTSCGALNVLIGKNNSGKSTILDAIDSFFQVMSTDSIVTVSSTPLGADTDFHRGGDSPKAIDIAITFDLEPDEFRHITESIINEAPQMKNALENAPATDCLRITVSSIEFSRPFAYISKIELTRHDGALPIGRTLLAIGSDTATEILTREQKRRMAERRSSELFAARTANRPRRFSDAQTRRVHSGRTLIKLRTPPPDDQLCRRHSVRSRVDHQTF